jgi:hypothetical protein
VKKQPNMPYGLSNQIIKERNEFNLKNKFEYGFDQNGGIIAGKEEEEIAKYNECLQQSAIGHE